MRAPSLIANTATILLMVTVALVTGGCRKADADTGAGRTDGAALFAAACSRCHGESGQGGVVAAGGKGPAPRDFHDGAFQTSRTDAQLRAAIVEGKNGFMPAFGNTFDAQQLDALVRHLRSFGPANGAKAP